MRTGGCRRCTGTDKQGGGWCKRQLWSLVMNEGFNVILFMAPSVNLKSWQLTSAIAT